MNMDTNKKTKMTKKQKMQVILAVLFAVLFIFWLFQPEWDLVKILGQLASASLCYSMIISYREEEKNKSNE